MPVDQLSALPSDILHHLCKTLSKMCIAEGRDERSQGYNGVNQCKTVMCKDLSNIPGYQDIWCCCSRLRSISNDARTCVFFTVSRQGQVQPHLHRFPRLNAIAIRYTFAEWLEYGFNSVAVNVYASLVSLHGVLPLLTTLLLNAYTARLPGSFMPDFAGC